MINGLLNNGSAIYEMGPASNSMERVVIKWLAGAIGFGDQSEGFLTSGGSLGNLTCLLAARQSRSGFNVWAEGHKTGFKPAVIVSREAHYSIARSVQILGWGEKALIPAPVDDNLALNPAFLKDLLKKASDEGRQVIAVVGNACTTSTGTYDPLDEIGDFCQENKLWFHVDGAHGGAAAISPKYRHLTEGITRADSVVIDFHKMMGISALTTAVLFRNPEPSYANFDQEAAYILERNGGYEWFNSAKRTVECTKNMMAVKPFAVLKLYGPGFFIDYLETCYDNGRKFARIIKEHESFELAVEPETNIVCFRYFTVGKDDEWMNNVNSSVRNKILEEGRFYIVQTSIRGKTYLRTSLMNPFTGEKELLNLLDHISELIESENEKP
jgi:L-2,4-diaminobutyrate decarboxylase